MHMPVCLRRGLAGTKGALLYSMSLPCRPIPGDRILWNDAFTDLTVVMILITTETVVVDCGPISLEMSKQYTDAGWELSE